MNIIKKSQDKYGLQKIGRNCHRVVKILNDYDNEQQAIDDLTKLMVGEISEQELIGGNLEQAIDAGKLNNRVNVLEAALEGIRDNLIQAMSDGDSMEGVVRNTIKRISELVE